MTDHLKTLRDLVAAGERATPLTARIAESDARRNQVVESEHPQPVDLYGQTDLANIPIATMWTCRRGSKELRLKNNPEFIMQAFNARPALAALLRVVEAAKELCGLRGDATEGDRENLRAALRDLSPEVEDE